MGQVFRSAPLGTTRLEIPWPEEIRCDWCFARPMPLQKHRAELRVQIAEDRWIKLCLCCWFSYAFLKEE